MKDDFTIFAVARAIVLLMMNVFHSLSILSLLRVIVILEYKLGTSFKILISCALFLARALHSCVGAVGSVVDELLVKSNMAHHKINVVMVCDSVVL